MATALQSWEEKICSAEDLLRRLFQCLSGEDDKLFIAAELWEAGANGLLKSEVLAYLSKRPREAETFMEELELAEVITVSTASGAARVYLNVNRWRRTPLRRSIVRLQDELPGLEKDDLAQARAGLGEADLARARARAQESVPFDRSIEVLENKTYSSRIIDRSIEERVGALQSASNGAARSSIEEKLRESRLLAAARAEVSAGTTLMARNFAIWLERDPGWLDGKLSEAKEKKNPIAWLNTVLDREFRQRKSTTENANGTESGKEASA